LVNAVTKSGTNEVHGGLFGYYQNRNLSNKNAYFWKNGFMTYDTDVNYLTFNTGQFGGFVGGPIVQDKAHFFVSVDIQQRAQTFGNAFQISGVDDDADIAKAGFSTKIAD